MATDTDVAVKLKLDTSSYMSEVDTAIKTTEKKFLGMSTKQQSAVKSVGDKISGAVKVATGAAVAGLGVFVKSSLDTYKGFQASMSNVGATLGFSIEELHDPTSQAAQDMKRLGDAAEQMGLTTRFSAAQSADALNYMAMAGYDVETSLSMLPKVLGLAAAGNLEIAQTSDMVTNVQSALGLSMENVDVLIDQMAKTASKSNTNVAQLGDALQKVGGTAKIISDKKGGMARLNAAIGILGDNGLQGAEGGTAIRNVLLSLTNPTDKAAGVMQQLGVKVFDSSGKMRDFDQIMLDLQKSVGGLNEEARMNVLGKIFNKRDLTAANALINTTKDRWTDLIGAVENSTGAAATMAATQEDNYQGALTRMGSAWEGFQIKVGKRVDENLGLQEAIDNLANFIAEHGDQIADFIAGIVTGVVNITTAVGNFLTSNPWVIEMAAVLMGVVASIVSVTKVVSATKVAFTALTSPVGLVVVAIAGLITIAIEVAKHWDEITTAVGNFFGAAGELLGGALEAVGNFFGGIFEAVGEFFSSVGQKIGEFFAAAWEVIATALAAVGEFLLGIGQWVWDNLLQPVIDFVKNCIIVIVAIVATILEAIYNAALKPIIDAVSAVATTIFDAVSSFIGSVIEAVTSFVEAVCDVIGTITGWVGDNVITPVADFFSGLWNGITTGVTDAIDGVKRIVGGIANWVNSNVIQPVGRFFKSLGEGIAKVFEGIKNVAQSIFGAIAGFIKAPINGIIGAINGVIRTINSIQVPDWVPIIGGAHANFSQIPLLATGGIVPATPGGRLVVAGEGGQDEWVVPESKMADLIGQISDRLEGTGAGQSITINVNGTFATSATERRKVAEQIVEAINQNNRRAMLA